MLLPVVLAPIAGKTVRELAVKNQEIPMPTAITAFVVAPMLVALILVAISVVTEKKSQTARTFAARTLLFTVWIFFLLNWAFFRQTLCRGNLGLHARLMASSLLSALLVSRSAQSGIGGVAVETMRSVIPTQLPMQMLRPRPTGTDFVNPVTSN